MHRENTTDLQKKRKPTSCFPCLNILQKLRKAKLVSYCARCLYNKGLGFAVVNGYEHSMISVLLMKSNLIDNSSSQKKGNKTPTMNNLNFKTY